MTRLQQLRMDAHLTPEKLGELAGVAGYTVRRIEAGRNTTPATLYKIADALNGLGCKTVDIKPYELQQLVTVEHDRSAA